MGTSALYSWAATDRAHERQEESDEDFDKHLSAETARQAAAIRDNCLIGHEQTLSEVACGVGCMLGEGTALDQLIRAALSCGPLTAGQLLLDMITKEIRAQAELAALKEIERGERSGGLDFAAMRAVSQEVVVPA